MEQLKSYLVAFVNVKEPFIDMILVESNDLRAKKNKQMLQNVFASRVKDPNRKP